MAHSLLVVEDEPNVVLSLRVLMERAGFDVRVAEDGIAALREVERAPPDIMLLDVMLPERDGYDVCRTIRANATWDNVRIVMLTAKGRDADREQGLAAGADAYVTKPFSTRDLVDQVKNLVGMGQG